MLHEPVTCSGPRRPLSARPLLVIRTQGFVAPTVRVRGAAAAASRDALGIGVDVHLEQTTANVPDIAHDDGSAKAGACDPDQPSTGTEIKSLQKIVSF